MHKRPVLGNNKMSDDSEETPFMMTVRDANDPYFLPCEELLRHNPSKAGYAAKKNRSIWAYLFPCVLPAWKRRYFVLIGSFLYRFSSEFDDSMKGVPIPIDAATLRVLDSTTLDLVTIRKSYTIQYDSEDDLQSWMKALQERKYLAIKENLGHSPLSSDTIRLNRIGNHHFNERLKKDRVDCSSNPMM